MQFDLVTPQAQLATGTADYINVPGSEGDFGVLDGHQPTLSALRPGALVVRDGTTETTYCVGFGFVDVTASKVTVLAEEAVNVTDLDAKTVTEALEAATVVAEKADSATDKVQAEKRVACLTAQLELVSNTEA